MSQKNTLPAKIMPATKQKRPSKRLIVFADGTGNAFGGQASNIWRLYEAIDKSDPTTGQLARYIPGVGTSSIGIFRAIDGATGIGVPGNVRKLYRFLCWNWEPGDEIWMFGFSRGAFTVRTLAGLIGSQGLMPRKIGKRHVTSAEMARNTKGAWRAYRSDTAPLRDPEKWWLLKMSPVVTVTRFVRDAVIGMKRFLSGEDSHGTVKAYVEDNHPELSPGNVKIRFMGLFDTVEAYGVPVEELRSVIDFNIWPISFRNSVCSPAVLEVAHALSLDDERLSFHPLRFDQSGSAKLEDPPRIEEVWFAGVHADIGGGYPDDAAAHEALMWMIKQSKAARLAFITEEVTALDGKRSDNAVLHDSRSGLKSAYRYTPRPIESAEKFGGRPVLHRSAINKIKLGGSGYGPVTLPADIRPEDWPDTKMGSPLTKDSETAEKVNTLVVWRRISNMAFVSLLVLLLVFPWASEIMHAILKPDEISPGSKGENVPALIGALLPGFAETWVQSLWVHLLMSLVLLAALLGLYLLNANLRDRIKDTARLAWGSKPADATDDTSRGVKVMLKTSQRMQKMRGLNWFYNFMSGFVVPAVLACLVLVGASKVVHVIAETYLTATGARCVALGEPDPLTPGTPWTIKPEFSPQNMCQDMGVDVVKGATYWVQLDETETFRDRGTPVPLDGFYTNNRNHVLGSLFKRHAGRWFQPTVQIGKSGLAITPLEEHSGIHPKLVKKWDHEYDKNAPGCDATTSKSETGRRFVARFTAEASGRLFLFVNDVSYWSWKKFYNNNRGCARVLIEQEASRLPPPPEDNE